MSGATEDIQNERMNGAFICVFIFTCNLTVFTLFIAFTVFYCTYISVSSNFVCTIDVDAKEPTLVEGPNTQSYLILSYEMIDIEQLLSDSLPKVSSVACDLDFCLTILRFGKRDLHSLSSVHHLTAQYGSYTSAAVLFRFQSIVFSQRLTITHQSLLSAYHPYLLSV